MDGYSFSWEEDWLKPKRIIGLVQFTLFKQCYYNKDALQKIKNNYNPQKDLV